MTFKFNLSKSQMKTTAVVLFFLFSSAAMFFAPQLANSDKSVPQRGDYLQLIDNHGVCFGNEECYTVYKIIDADSNKFKDKDFDFLFFDSNNKLISKDDVKHKTTSDLKSFAITFLSNTSYQQIHDNITYIPYNTTKEIEQFDNTTNASLGFFNITETLYNSTNAPYYTTEYRLEPISTDETFFKSKIAKDADEYFVKLSGFLPLNGAVDNVISFAGYNYTEYAWWNSSWSYVRPITITNTSILSDYQVLINITNTTNMNATGQDIRFTYNDNTTSIPYWIESWTTNNAQVWVKTNQSLINLWYGNPTAINQSNISSTFIIGDDFNGASLDTSNFNALTKGTGASVSVYGGLAHLNVTGSNTGSANLNSTKVFTNNVSIVINRRKISGTNNYYMGTAFGNGSVVAFQNDGTTWYMTQYMEGYSYYFDVSGGQRYIYKATPTLTSLILLNPNSVTDMTNLRTYQFDYWSNGTMNFYIFNMSKSLIGTATNDTYANMVKNLDIFQGGYSGQADSKYGEVDFVYVRKITSTEPTTSIGSQQTNGEADTIPPTLTVSSPINNTNYSTASIWFNMTGNETLDWSAVSLDGAANQTLTNSSSNWNYQNTSMTQGLHWAIFYGNDSSGNIGVSGNYSFRVDSIAPVVSITTPASDGLWYSTAPDLTASCTDTNFVNMTINHTSYTATKTSTPATWTNISEIAQGGNSFMITCTDIAGNTGTANRSFNFDNLPPAFSYLPPTPANASYVSANYTAVNLSITEPNLDTFKFSWNGTNYSFYDSSLVLAMNFNNNSAIGENATYAVDISKYGNNGTLVNGTAWTTAGKYGGALQFDGVDDYVNAGNAVSLNITDAITVEAWIKGGAQDDKVILSKFENVLGNYRSWAIGSEQIGLTGGNTKLKVSVSADGGTTNYKRYTSSVVVMNNVWHHIAFTFTSNNLSIYVDGVLDTSPTKSTDGTVTTIYATDAPVRVSAVNSVPLAFFNGLIDNVQIYNRALSASEIQMHYQSEFQKYNSTEYRFYNNVSSLLDSVYTYYGIANDTSGNSASSTQQTVTIDTTKPAIDFISPTDTNGTTVSRNYTFVNTSVLDTGSPNNLTGLINFDNSLVGWWRFNEGTGTTATDYSGYGNTGTLTNMNSGLDNGNSGWNSSGKFGNAMAFDGVDDKVNVIYGSSLNTTNNVTVDAWVKWVSGRSHVVGLGTFGNDYQQVYYLRIEPDGSLCFIIGNSTGTSALYLYSVNAISTNTWTHITVKISNTNVSIYINGILDKTGSVYSRYVTNTHFTIGTLSSSSFPFNGLIDDVRIYNRALSAEEINASYNAGLNRLYHNFTGLSDGEHNYTAYVQDLAGNVNSTAKQYVTIDTTPPTAVTLLTPTDGDHTNTNQTAFDWTDATDATGVDKYQLQIANNSGFADAAIIRNITGIAVSAYTLTEAQALSDGTYYWRARANDTVGNGYTIWGEAGNFTLIIDTIMPDWIISSYPNAYNTSIVSNSVTWDAKVYDTNLFRILLNVTNSSGSVYSNYTEDWNTSWFNFTNTVDMSAWSDGNYTVELSATDDHTDTETDLKKYKKGEAQLIFNSTTSETNVIAYFVEKSDKLTDTPGDFVSSVSDMTPQGYYKFGYNFTVLKPETKLILNISSNKKITYRTPQSGFKGHFVWDSYYIDFADVPAGSMDVIVTKISDYKYQVKIQGKTQWVAGQFIEIDPVAGGLNTRTEYYILQKDSTAPFVNITSPQNKTYTTTNISINYTASDTNINTTWYQYNGTNTTLSGNTTFTALDNQQSTLTLYANDSTGNINSTSVVFTTDLITPQYSGAYKSPEGDVQKSQAQIFYINVSDATHNISQVWLIHTNVDNTAANTTYIMAKGSGNQYSVSITPIAVERMHYQYYMNNSVNNINSTEVYAYNVLGIGSGDGGGADEPETTSYVISVNESENISNISTAYYSFGNETRDANALIETAKSKLKYYLAFSDTAEERITRTPEGAIIKSRINMTLPYAGAVFWVFFVGVVGLLIKTMLPDIYRRNIIVYAAMVLGIAIIVLIS